jgi:hypothetical protein
MPLRRGFGVAALLAATACGRERAGGHEAGVGDSSAATSGTAAGAMGAARGSSGGPAGDCPRTGHWSACQVRRRLEQAGLAPQPTDTLKDLHLPAVGAAPAVYTVGTAPLAIYLFADSSSRNRAARGLDTTRFIPQSRELSIRGEATAIQNDNLLAILFSRRDQQRERVADALSAGPPQP